jgi:CubicO group peptidase (beta-lactamase class C family)
MLVLALQMRAFPEDAQHSLPVGDWAEHGFTEAQRGSIRNVCKGAVDREAIAGGSLLLIHKGEAIHREAFGVADLETQRPFTVEAPCRIASVTKPHTATVIVMLAHAGKLSLDEPVDKHLPAFHGIRVAGQGPAKQAPTLAQCLSHTAGFPGNDALKRGETDVDLEGSLAEVVDNLARQELIAAPGSAYAYSRLGYMVAGRVAEVVTGKDFAAVMQELLLDPIGARDATFYPDDETLAAIPTWYERTRNGLRPRTGERLGTAINPGGGLVSTLDDVGRVMLLHRNRGRVGDRELVPAEWLEKMYVPQPNTPGGYGLGFNILQRRPDGTARRVQHLGASGTLALIDFDADLIVVILTQTPTPRQGWRNQLLQAVGNVFGSGRSE